MAERFVMHVDLEGWLLALEIRANPSLEGRSMVIGGMPDQPGIVVAHSRELRRAGIRPGMLLAEAAEIAPRAIFLPSRPREYAEAHDRAYRHLLRETDRVEPLALGEFFVDGEGRASDRESAVRWASSLQASLRRVLGVDAAIGIGSDKLMAKMCSGLHRGGITWMDASGFREAFWTRPLESLWGMGSRTIHSLRDLGMATVGDLGKTDPATLAPYFGDRAAQLVDLAHGRSGSKVAPPDEEARGPFIHREWNAESPLHSRVKLNRQLSHLVDALSGALQREHRLAERIEVAVVWDDFWKTIRQASLDFPASDRAELYPWVEALFRRFDLGGGVRALGVTAARLSPAPARAPAPFAFTAPLEPAR